MAQAAGVTLLHVPHKRGPEAIQEVMAGRAGFTMAALSTALANIKGGKLRALGVSTPARSDAAAEIPSIAELGYKDFDIALWFELWAPAGTPAAVMQRINADVAQAQRDPEVQATFGRVGIKARSMSTAEFSQFVGAEIDKHNAIAKAARIEAR